jgi:hypothetical protein
MIPRPHTRFTFWPRLGLCVLMFCGALVIGVCRAPAAGQPEILAQTEKELALLKQNVAKARAVVEQAIAEAVKADRILPAIGALYLEALAKVPAEEALFTDPQRLSFGMNFDGGADTQAINLSWTNYKDEAQRGFYQAEELATRYTEAVVEALRTAARTAQKPQEVQHVDALIAGMSKFPASPLGRSVLPRRIRMVLQQLSTLVQNVLEATQKEDGPAASRAFAYVYSSALTNVNLEGESSPLRAEGFIEEFRARVRAPFLARAAAVQREAEQMIMGGKSAEEVERQLGVLHVAYMTANALRRSASISYQNGLQRVPMVEYYRSVMRVVHWLKNEDPEAVGSRPSIDGMSYDEEFPVGVEFRAFADQLPPRQATHFDALSVRREARRAAEEETRREEEGRRVRAATAELVKTYKHKLALVKTAETALALILELPDGQERGERIDWQALATELHSIAKWWLAGLPPAPTDDAETTQEAPQAGYHPFLMETRALRDRAMRDVAVNRLHMEELNAPPLRDMSTGAALEKLAQDAANRGEWRRCHEILRVLTRAEGYSDAVKDWLPGVRGYLRGQNLELAGQFRQAAESYLAVIGEIGDFLPVKEAGERLRKLQSAHPEILQENQRDGGLDAK